jgi:dipeptidyl aminopeptidase/acylaminoacyl peptidase
MAIPDATAPISVAVANRRRRSLASWLLRLAILLTVMAVIAYGIGAVLVYGEVSRSADFPTADGRPRFGTVTPANLRFEVGGVAHDFSRYEMPDFAEVRFPSRDPGIEIAAWFVPSSRGAGAPAVILVHGLRASRHDPSVLVPAGMLHAHGFAVVLIDLRDHGDSTWEDGRYAGGMEEQADVLGARDWLVGQGVSAERIGLFGTSMGAGAVLIAAAVDSSIPAVWEDSSYADTEQRIAEELDRRGLPTILAPSAPFVARILAGDDLWTWSPLKAVATFDDTALYVTHGADDHATDVHHAHDLYAAAVAAGVGVELWVAPVAGHVRAYLDLTDDYEIRLSAFFEQHLGRR